MSFPSHNSNESEGTILKNLMEKIAQDVQKLSYRQLHLRPNLRKRMLNFL